NGAEDVGFDAGQTSVRTVAVTSSADGPALGRLPADLSFHVALTTVDGRSIGHQLVLTGASNASNTLLTQLADQLETLLNAAFAGDFTGSAFDVSVSSGKLHITTLDGSIKSVTLEG